MVSCLVGGCNTSLPCGKKTSGRSGKRSKVTVCSFSAGGSINLLDDILQSSLIRPYCNWVLFVPKILTNSLVATGGLIRLQFFWVLVRTASWSSELLTAAWHGDLPKMEAALRSFADPDSQAARVESRYLLERRTCPFPIFLIKFGMG